MLKYIVLLLGFLSITTACSNVGLQFYILTDSAEGLSKNTKILVNGLEVGNVSRLSLTKEHKILVRVQVALKDPISIDSKFLLQPLDHRGEKAIFVQSGVYPQDIQSGDTLRSQIYQVNLGSQISYDSFLPRLENFLNTLDSQDQCDSLLIEIRRLNERLDQIKEAD